MAFFPAFEASGHGKLARKVHALCTGQEHAPRAEYGLVDEVAGLLVISGRTLVTLRFWRSGQRQRVKVLRTQRRAANPQPI